MTNDMQFPIVGRAQEQAILAQTKAAADQGHGALVLLGGETGIGKTALIDHFIHETGFPAILKGWCPGAVETPPYGPWLDVVAALRGLSGRGTAELPEPFGRAPGSSPVYTLADQLLAWLTDATPAGNGALVIVLEDIHWADALSLKLLRFMLPRLANAPLLIIATYRSDLADPQTDLGALLPDLQRAGALRLTLERLDMTAVRELVRVVLPDAARADEQALCLHQRTGGHPLFVCAMLTLALRSGGANRDTLPLPETVQQALEQRLSSLGQEALIILRAAAVIGERFSYNLLSQIVPDDEEHLLASLEAAIALRIIHEDGEACDRFAFDHGLMREVLLAGVIGPRRRRLHLSIAQALQTTPGTDPEVLASHLSQAGDPRAVAEWLAAMNRALRLGAMTQAARLGEQALAQMDEIDPRRPEALLKVGVAHRFGHDSRAKPYWELAVQAASTHGDRAVATWARHYLATWAYFMRQGNALDLMARVQTDEATLLEDPRYRELQMDLRGHVSDYPPLAITHASGLALSGRLQEAEALVAQIRAEAMDTFDEVDLRYVEANVAMYAGRAASAIAWYEEASTVEVQRINYRMAFLNKWSQLMAMLFAAADRPTDLDAVAIDVVRLEKTAAERSGQRWMPEGYCSIGFLQFFRGDWINARHNLIDYIDAAPDVYDRTWWRWYAGLLCLAQGEPDRADSIMAPVVPLEPHQEIGFERISVYCHSMRARICLARGDLAKARAWLEAADRHLEERELVGMRAEVWLRWAELHILSNCQAEARERAFAALAQAREIHDCWHVVEAERLLGQLDARRGAVEAAQLHFIAAIDLAARCRFPYELALTQLAMAESLPEANGVWAGLAEACAVFARLGAAPVLAQAEALMATQRQKPPPLPNGLTEREAEVVRLVGEGLRDKEIAAALFISVKTVQSHLRNIFNKVGVSNRAALVGYAARRGLFQ